MKKLQILGIRGLPAAHGGFETFAEYLALYLIERGWEVTVYCQEAGNGDAYESEWRGIKRIHIPVAGDGPKSTVIFDYKSVLASCNQPGLILTLGYNTAIFNSIYRLRGKANLINMDGIEWRRGKWGAIAKTWFYLNERFGCCFGNHLIADHPHIKKHLATRVSESKITMIPYGADPVFQADASLLAAYGLAPNNFGVLIARAEPENSILEAVQAFSSKRRNRKLVVLGKYEPATNAYHRAVLAAASDEVAFVGAIYEKPMVNALRHFARFYIHGHQVGGTNPSLVEALGACSPVLAHDNAFNRWVAGDAAIYFADANSCSERIDRLFSDDSLIEQMRSAAKIRFNTQFTWDRILLEYEALLLKWL